MWSPKQEEAVKAAIRQRLRGVCAHMSAEEFEGLVAKIAATELGQSADAPPRDDQAKQERRPGGEKSEYFFDPRD